MANNTETKVIRLNWCSDEQSTFEDYIVPKNTPKEAIELAVDLSLAVGEDECEVFKTVLTKMGYPTVVLNYVTEEYNFDYVKSDLIEEALNGDYETVINIAEKLGKETVENKESIYLQKLNEIEVEEKDKDELKQEILKITL